MSGTLSVGLGLKLVAAALTASARALQDSTWTDTCRKHPTCSLLLSRGSRQHMVRKTCPKVVLAVCKVTPAQPTVGCMRVDKEFDSCFTVALPGTRAGCRNLLPALSYVTVASTPSLTGAAACCVVAA